MSRDKQNCEGQGRTGHLGDCQHLYVRLRNLTLPKMMWIVEGRILVWGGEIAEEQRTDPSQPHLKPVTQPKTFRRFGCHGIEIAFKMLTCLALCENMWIWVAARSYLSASLRYTRAEGEGVW